MSGAKESLLLNQGSLLSEDYVPTLPERSVTWRLMLCATIGSIHAMQYGWAIGIINFPADVISKDLGIDPKGWAWSGGIVASFCVAGFLGTSFAGGLADSWGRRRLIVALNVPFLLAAGAAVGAGLVKGTAGYALMVVSRVLVGLASGVGSVVTPMYLGEIATESTRGAFGALFQFQITVFILLVQLASMPGAMDSSALWGPLFGISGVFAVLALLAGPLLLESPKWLVKQGRQDHARSVLAQLRGITAAEADEDAKALEEPEEGGGDEEGGGGSAGAGAGKDTKTLGQVLGDSYYRLPLLVLCVLMVTQQFSGINAIFYYSAGFFKDAGVDATVGTIAAGAVNLLATGIAIPLIERLGRRTLILAGIGGMGLSTGGLVAALQVKAAHPELTTPLGYTAILFVMSGVAFFEIGLGAIPWSIGGELFPQDAKGAAMGLGAAVNWTCTTLVGLGFPILQAALPNGLSFLPFAVCLAAAFLFALRYVPETKGKTAEQILLEMNSGYSKGLMRVGD